MKPIIFLPPELREEYILVRGVVEHEDNLINHRNSWLILAQSFLLAAFIGSDTYQCLIVIAGFVSALFCYISILAAIWALERIRQVPGWKFNDYYPYLTSPTWRHYLGLAGALCVPLTFIVIWICIAAQKL
ncbi:MAG: hypothetical protein GYA46_07465 [candidate division Zixibacteria bacterium]|nr:hypothetical protein [candidate division Zixibacteria bacterium]